jgi:ketosteroid isomerase-like protein
MHSSWFADADTPQWQQDIQALEEQNRLAFLAQDIDTLRQLWSDDFIVNSPLNRIHDKDQILDLLQKGIILHAFFEVHIELIRRNGDIVVVMGRETVIGKPGTTPFHRRFTNFWYAEGRSWRLVARHANLISQS